MQRELNKFRVMDLLEIECAKGLHKFRMGKRIETLLTIPLAYSSLQVCILDSSLGRFFIFVSVSLIHAFYLM